MRLIARLSRLDTFRLLRRLFLPNDPTPCFLRTEYTFLGIIIQSVLVLCYRQDRLRQDRVLLWQILLKGIVLLDGYSSFP
jgi:hypothetical protein